MNRRVWYLVGWFSILCASLFAAPGLMNYQGRLTNSAGEPIINSVNVTFTFWDAEIGGSQLGSGFSDADAVTPDADGIYFTLIGDDPGNLIPESVFSANSVWLNVNISGENLAPRMRIVSMGFALNSSKADTAATAAMAMNAINANNAVSAVSALKADSAGNADMLNGKTASDFAASAHGHNLQDLSGAATDAQVPDDITINHAATATTAGYAATAGSATTATTASGLSGALSAPGDRIALGNNIWLQVGLNGKTYLSVNGQRLALGAAGWANPFGLSDNISPDGQNADLAAAAMDNNGNAIIVWAQSDGSFDRIFKSEYRGGAWKHPSGLSDAISIAGKSALYPAVAMDNNGKAIIVWYQDDGSNTQIFKAEYRNGSWTLPSSLSDNISPDGQDAHDPRVAMDNHGNAIIAWLQYDGSYTQVYKSEYRGGAWTHPSGLANHINPSGPEVYLPCVAMDDNGNAIIIWEQFDASSQSQIFKSEYRAGAWTHPSGLSDNISPDGQGVTSPQVVMDKSGNAIIVWAQSDGSTSQIFKSEYRAGAWTHPSGLSDNISLDGAWVTSPKAAMDNNGNAIIAWEQLKGMSFQIYKSERRSGVWTHPASASDNISLDGQSVGPPFVAMDDNANALIVWGESDGSNIQVFKSEYRDGAWTHPSGFTDNISPDGQAASPAQALMDINGNAIIVWRQDTGSVTQVFMSEYRFRF